MSQADTPHPSPEELAAFAGGRLDPDAQAVVARHVATCDTCCDVFRGLPDDSLVAALRQVTVPTVPAPDAPAPTARNLPAAGSSPPPELARHPRYRILRMLGAGGTGVVYQAEDQLMDRLVALKVLGRELAGDPVAVERLGREVRAAARLAHPNVVAVHEADLAGDLPFVVMEYVEGISLASVAERHGPLPVAHACAYARQAARGLQHAHERGLVHRDIRPQNLLLTRPGLAKVLGFGLGWLARPAAGAPDYRAPEQAGDASGADVRSDLYSLGCTLFFLLTGRPPSPAGHPPQPVNVLRPDAPADLAAVVGRMTARDPARRYRTAAEVVAALAPYAKVGPVPAAERPAVGCAERPEARLPRPVRWLALAAGCLGLATCLAGGVLVVRHLAPGSGDGTGERTPAGTAGEDRFGGGIGAQGEGPNGQDSHR
jgi:serine/threonine-protein kinase